MTERVFFELWGGLRWFFALALCSFSEDFNPQWTCFNVLCFVPRKDTSLTLAVKRPEQFALYTFPNKLSSKELLITKNITPMELCAEYWKFSWKPNNVCRLANDEKFGFQTFSLTSQYAALYALNMRSFLWSFFSCTFFFLMKCRVHSFW